MSNASTRDNMLPVVDYLKIPDAGEPYLEGLRCSECEAVFTKRQTHCARCFSRDSLQPHRLGATGNLYTYSIVHRTFPGIQVPFISAYVDLDGGGTITGNLINVEPTPEAIDFDLRVNVVFAEALGRKDTEGNSYLSYFFEPA